MSSMEFRAFSEEWVSDAVFLVLEESYTSVLFRRHAFCSVSNHTQTNLDNMILINNSILLMRL